MRHRRQTAGSAAASIAVTFILLTSQASQVRLSHQHSFMLFCPFFVACSRKNERAWIFSMLYDRAMQGSRLLQSSLPASPQQPAALVVLPPIPQADATSSPGSAEPTRRASPSTSNPVAIHIQPPPESPAQADAGQQSPTSTTSTTPNMGGAAFTSGAQWHSSANFAERPRGCIGTHAR